MIVISVFRHDRNPYLGLTCH